MPRKSTDKAEGKEEHKVMFTREEVLPTKPPKSKMSEEERKRREKIFGSPEWIEKHVIPFGERTAYLWRHLHGTWKDNQGMLRKEWGRHSPTIKGLGKIA